VVRPHSGRLPSQAWYHAMAEALYDGQNQFLLLAVFLTG
jgi:hypothetical protein